MVEAQQQILTTGGDMLAAGADARMQAMIAALRHVGAPLLAALTETSAGAKKTSAPDLTPFPSLVEAASALARLLAGSGDAAPRWAALRAASQLVAAHYRATAQVLDQQGMESIVASLAPLRDKFAHLGGDGAEDVDGVIAFRAHTLEAMVPVVGAIAQYAFGRAEHLLLAEVSERLMKTADQMTRTLAPAGADVASWRLLCWSLLRAGGQIYADSHYAEADRLLDMVPDERAAYFAKNGNLVPMTRVWQEYNQRLALLATLGAYLEVPAEARLAAEGWG